MVYPKILQVFSQDTPFPINFYYSKKSLIKYFLAYCVKLSFCIHLFNISRYLTGIDNIRAEVELQTKFVNLIITKKLIDLIDHNGLISHTTYFGGKLF